MPGDSVRDSKTRNVSQASGFLVSGLRRGRGRQVFCAGGRGVHSPKKRGRGGKRKTRDWQLELCRALGDFRPTRPGACGCHFWQSHSYRAKKLSHRCGADAREILCQIGSNLPHLATGNPFSGRPCWLSCQWAGATGASTGPLCLKSGPSERLFLPGSLSKTLCSRAKIRNKWASGLYFTTFSFLYSLPPALPPA